MKPQEFGPQFVEGRINTLNSDIAETLEALGEVRDWLVDNPDDSESLDRFQYGLHNLGFLMEEIPHGSNQLIITTHSQDTLPFTVVGGKILENDWPYFSHDSKPPNHSLQIWSLSIMRVQPSIHPIYSPQLKGALDISLRSPVYETTLQKVGRFKQRKVEKYPPITLRIPLSNEAKIRIKWQEQPFRVPYSVLGGAENTSTAEN